MEKYYIKEYNHEIQARRANTTIHKYMGKYAIYNHARIRGEYDSYLIFEDNEDYDKITNWNCQRTYKFPMPAIKTRWNYNNPQMQKEIITREE